MDTLQFDKALIIRKAWLDLILEGIKLWEMRSRATTMRGHIGLIEAGSGLIKGQATLCDCLRPLSVIEFCEHESKHRIPYKGNEKLVHKCDYPWVLDNPVKFTQPIRYKHPQGAVTWVRITQDILLMDKE